MHQVCVITALDPKIIHNKYIFSRKRVKKYEESLGAVEKERQQQNREMIAALQNQQLEGLTTIEAFEAQEKKMMEMARTRQLANLFERTRATRPTLLR